MAPTRPLPERAALSLGGPFDVDRNRARYLERPHPSFPATSPHVEHLRELYSYELAPTVVARDPDGSAVLDSHALQPLELAGWALHLPWPQNPLPANARYSHRRLEWAAVQKVRETARFLCLRRIPPQDRIRIRLDWEVVSRRTRDEDNLWKAAKALTDGVRLAGVVPDDDRRFVLRESPEIHYAPTDPASRPAAFMRFWILKVNPS